MKLKNLVQQLCIFFMLTLISCSAVVERNPAPIENEIFNSINIFSSVSNIQFFKLADL